MKFEMIKIKFVIEIVIEIGFYFQIFVGFLTLSERTQPVVETKAWAAKGRCGESPAGRV